MGKQWTRRLGAWVGPGFCPLLRSKPAPSEWLKPQCALSHDSYTGLTVSRRARVATVARGSAISGPQQLPGGGARLPGLEGVAGMVQTPTLCVGLSPSARAGQPRLGGAGSGPTSSRRAGLVLQGGGDSMGPLWRPSVTSSVERVLIPFMLKGREPSPALHGSPWLPSHLPAVLSPTGKVRRKPLSLF